MFQVITSSLHNDQLKTYGTHLPYRGKHWRVATLVNSLQKHVDEINFGEFEAPAKFYLI